MKWYPHETNASDSGFISELEREFGNNGYAVWFKVLEILYSKDSFDEAVWISTQTLANKCHLRVGNLRLILDYCETKGKLKCNYSGTLVGLYSHLISLKCNSYYKKRLKNKEKQPTDSITIENHFVLEEKKREEKKREGKIEKNDTPPPSVDNFKGLQAYFKQVNQLYYGAPLVISEFELIDLGKVVQDIGLEFSRACVDELYYYAKNWHKHMQLPPYDLPPTVKTYCREIQWLIEKAKSKVKPGGSG